MSQEPLKANVSEEAVESISEEKQREISEKYDADSMVETRKRSVLDTIVRWVAIGMSLYHIIASLTGTVPALQHRGIHLAFVLFLGFMVYPFSKKYKGKHTPWDCALALVGTFCGAYIAINYNDIIFRAGTPLLMDQVMFVVSVVVIFIAVRRSVGKSLIFIPLAFLLYAYYGRYMPGFLKHRGVSLMRLTSHLFLGTEGIFGVSLGTCATYIIVFVIFAAFLEKSGLGNLINDLAMALTGWTVGGPAKMAVVSSAVFGSISGSAVANVVSTGAFTIPMMKKCGYQNEFAGGVEAVASTGGQLMPPIMGAAAFIMADTMGVSYLTIVKAAIIPVFLYYLSIFVAVHLRAKKLGLKGVSRENLPNFMAVLKARGHLLVPFVAVIVMLCVGFTALFTGTIGILLVIVFAALRKETRMSVQDILGALEKGAKGGLSVSISCAAVGIIVGIFTLTGLSSTLGLWILKVGENSMYLSLILVMFLSILLGMGLPTVAVYILLASVAVPVLVKLGINNLSAHFFVFYFGLMAGLTPPVAVTSYAAAGMADANPTKTALAGLKLAAVGFLVPYLFTIAPEMLFAPGTSLWASLYSGSMAVIGVCLMASAIEGYLARNMKAWERILAGIAALLLIYPETVTDIIGLVILVGLYLMQRYGAKNKTAAA